MSENKIEKNIKSNVPLYTGVGFLIGLMFGQMLIGAALGALIGLNSDKKRGV